MDKLRKILEKDNKGVWNAVVAVLIAVVIIAWAASMSGNDSGAEDKTTTAESFGSTDEFASESSGIDETDKAESNVGEQYVESDEIVSNTTTDISAPESELYVEETVTEKPLSTETVDKTDTQISQPTETESHNDDHVSETTSGEVVITEPAETEAGKETVYEGVSGENDLPIC